MAETDDANSTGGWRTGGIVVLAIIATAAALYFGREFFVPIVFAALLSVTCRPMVRWLHGKLGLPDAIAAAIVVIALIAALFVAGWSLVAPVQRWLNEAPDRFTQAVHKLERFRRPVQQASDVAQKIEEATQAPTTSPAQPPVPKGPGLADRAFGNATSFIGGLVEVLLLAYLLLASGDMFLQKLIKVIPRWRDKANAVQAVEEAESAVLRYLLVTLLINLVQGAVVGLTLWLLKMPNPVLWGLLTVLLEFIPYLGAAAMILMLSIIAFATFDNLGHALAVPGSYLLITTIQNNVASPIAYGRRLKLNPVAVLIGVLLWWFLWGIPGAFLAVPIIATIKIIADRSESMKAVGEFLDE